MKKSLIFPLIALSLLSFVSAYYGEFSFGSFFEAIGWENLFLATIFIVFFFFINLAISRFSRDKTTGEPNKGAWIPALLFSLLITGGIYFSDFSVENFFFDIGVSTDTIMMVLPIILLGGAIYLFWKFKGKTWFILGGFFILLGFFIYEKTTTIIIGIILLAVGFFLWKRKRYPKEEQSRNYSYSYAK